jgi:hypothetical protein
MKIHLNSCCVKRLLKSTLFLIFSFVFYSVNADPLVVSTKTEYVFQLHILKEPWDKYMSNLDKTLKNVMTRLEKIDLSSESLIKITENEIESYNWSDQSILLAVDAIPSLSIIGVNSNKRELMQIAEQTVKFGAGITGVTFLVIFKGKKLYGGALDNEISARRYQVPTLFIQIAAVYDTHPPQIQLRFVIRPLKTYQAISTGYQALDEQLKKRIEIPEVHDFFKRIGKITYDDAPHRMKPWLPKVKPVLKQAK